jgi:hypothetical protein
LAIETPSAWTIRLFGVPVTVKPTFFLVATGTLEVVDSGPHDRKTSMMIVHEKAIL